MRNTLQQLRKQRTILDRAIRGLEKLDKLKSSHAQDQRNLQPSTSRQEIMPGRLIAFRGGASRSKVSRSRAAASEPSPRTGPDRGASNG